MELSEYVSALRRELSSLTRFAGDDVTRVAELLAQSLDPAVRLTLLDVLTAAAAEITSRLDSAVIDVRLSSGEPEFVITARPSEEPAEPARGTAEGTEEAGTSRVTLRISEALKARVEAAAAAAGVSVNSWLIRAAAEALDGPRPAGRTRRSGVGQHITGYHRS
ncbi:MAG: toxin-antitoxin system HicB family antitoxin [Streptosporangiaceae bacterium]